MDLIINNKDCCGCYACYNVCPRNAIDMVENDKGFKQPEINKKKCINCGLCKKVCPIINNRYLDYKIQTYALKNKNLEERKNSSSGGAFILLAKYILNKNGIVYGAAFDENFNVKHMRVDKTEDIQNLMASKYVQSEIGNSYLNAKKDLEAGKYVLFTGTPCQIEGLNTFLRKDYDNLYTQDIVCHGVPSPKVWNKYKEYRLKKDKEKIEKISFRNKDNGWNNYNIKFIYKNSKFKINHNDDKYMNAFLRNTILRDSCYNCKFKNKKRNSDITLADYWGIENINPDFYDEYGVSLITINSEKGRKLFNNIKERSVYIETDLDEAIKYNPSYITSSKMDKHREEFFKRIDSMEFDKLVNKYTDRPSFINRLNLKVKWIIKKIIKK